MGISLNPTPGSEPVPTLEETVLGGVNLEKAEANMQLVPVQETDRKSVV